MSPPSTFLRPPPLPLVLIPERGDSTARPRWWVGICNSGGVRENAAECMISTVGFVNLRLHDTVQTEEIFYFPKGGLQRAAIET